MKPTSVPNCSLYYSSELAAAAEADRLALEELQKEGDKATRNVLLAQREEDMALRDLKEAEDALKAAKNAGLNSRTRFQLMQSLFKIFLNCFSIDKLKLLSSQPPLRGHGKDKGGIRAEGCRGREG